MSTWQAFWLGVAVAYVPSLIFVAVAIIAPKARIAAFLYSRTLKRLANESRRELMSRQAPVQS